MTTYYVDLVNGSDAYAGDSFAVGHPFKTLKKNFAAGDIVLVAKNVETGLAGTLSVVANSFSVTTTDDLSGTLAQYSFIRINGENRIYMVKACTSSVITLYSPYEGTTTSGLSATWLTLPVTASGDLIPSGNGAYGNLITVKGGINPTNDVQDGFTIANCNNGSYGIGSATPSAMSYWGIQRLGIYYAARLWNLNLTDCILTDCSAFRAVTSFNYNQSWKRTTINGFVSEQAKCKLPTINCDIIDLRTSDDGTHGLDTSDGNFTGNSFLRWKNAGYSGKNALYIANAGGGANRFYDANFDVSASGCQMIGIVTSGYMLVDFTFHNPIIGSGTLVGCGVYGLTGRLKFQNINGDPTDNREYVSEFYAPTAIPQSITGDYSVYKTAAPSVKVVLQQSTYPLIVRHYIPCQAGVQKTVSVWVRKNTSYGAAGAGTILPTMRLRWFTGSSGSLTSNVHDVTMSDTANAFEQISYAVTPGVKGVIVVELIFQSSASGAIAYYDDLEAT